MKRVIWEGKAQRVTLTEEADGSIVLTHATDYDNGPAQSIRVPSEAVDTVAAEFWGLSIRRTMALIGETIARVRAIGFGVCPRCDGTGIEPAAITMDAGDGEGEDRPCSVCSQ